MQFAQNAKVSGINGYLVFKNLKKEIFDSNEGLKKLREYLEDCFEVGELMVMKKSNGNDIGEFVVVEFTRKFDAGIALLEIKNDHNFLEFLDESALLDGDEDFVGLYFKEQVK